MIQFGTGGWRAIIGDQFIKENINKVAQAIADKTREVPVVVGYDRRFLSDMGARWIAEVLAGNNIPVYFINKPVPTPMIMFAVKHMQTQFGIAVTASHNPAVYNGLKVFTQGGKDATQAITDELERAIQELGAIEHLPFEQALQDGLVRIFDPTNDYIDAILQSVDVSAIRNAHLRILIDPMFGVSKTSLSIILNTARCDIEIINSRHDTLFGGKLPSPASSTLQQLSQRVVNDRFDLGIATDGDADRIGIVDENGAFIHPNILIALLYFYLLEYKQWSGPVVRNLSTSHYLDAIAHDHGEICYETPVGFKHISEAIDKYDALIGGESSGGLTIRGHISGKDGIFAATLLVEMIGVAKKKLSDLVDDLYSRYGQRYFQERSYSFDDAKKEMIQQTLFDQQAIPAFTQDIREIRDFDGLKIVFADDSWVSARFSGTEPLLRIFSESVSESFSIDVINALEQFLEITADK